MGHSGDSLQLWRRTVLGSGWVDSLHRDGRVKYISSEKPPISRQRPQLVEENGMEKQVDAMV